jgi:hypothetical protein
VTDARGLDLDPGFAGLGTLLDEIHDLEWLIGLVEYGGFHGDLLGRPLLLEEGVTRERQRRLP